MGTGDWFRTVWQAVTTGLAIAFLWVLLQPGLLLAPAPGPDRVVPAAPAQEPIRSYAAAVRAAAPSVVSIYATREPGATRRGESGAADPRRSAGSGVVVSVGGFILTNLHVVEGASGITVLLSDGRRAPAGLIGSDPLTDLAVLQAELPDVPLITIAEMDKVQVGDVALAIGNPYGFSQTVTQGIVSATGRNRVGISILENFIQTDAAINPGNSGGALVNSRGELIGIATAMISDGGSADGIGFAIPANMAIDVMHDILEQGTVRRGWLGVDAVDLRPDEARRAHLAGRAGVKVLGIALGSPAHRAGLLPGDVLTAIDGVPMLDSRSVTDLVTSRAPGSRAELEIVRNGVVFSVATIIEQRPPTQIGG